MPAKVKNTKLTTHTSAAKSLFLGNIVEENLFPFPQMNSEELETVRMIVDSIDKFAGEKGEDYRVWDREGKFPKEYIESLKELGLFGLIIPEEFDGIGLSSMGYARAVQQMGRYDGATCVTIGAHSSIGLKGLLLFGTDAQKKKYLSHLASGEYIAAFCLTEPGAGSDAASIKTHAKKNADGTWTLSGEKLWISNGEIAQFFTVFARTEGEKGKITAFIVERNWPGISVGPKEDKMGIRASVTNAVHFQNVIVPAENILGEEGMGFKVAMSILNNGRTGLGGGCLGGMKSCIALAAKHATERKQFGKSISEYGIIKEKLGRMTVDCFVSESLVQMLTHYIDSEVEDYSVEAAIIKVFISEALWRVANESLQIAGGNGYMREFPYERIVRDARINLIFEGTNEILRLYIALSGMKDAGASLKELSSGLANIFNDPIKGFGVLGNFAVKKLGRLTSTGRDRIENIAPELRADASVIEKHVVNLAQAAETLLRRHGKSIVDKQLALKRAADIGIDVFAGLCVLSRVDSLISARSAKNCEHEINMAHIFTAQADRRIRENLEGIKKNEDEMLKSLGDYTNSSAQYMWDVI